MSHIRRHSGHSQKRKHTQLTLLFYREKQRLRAVDLVQTKLHDVSACTDEKPLSQRQEETASLSFNKKIKRKPEVLQTLNSKMFRR